MEALGDSVQCPARVHFGRRLRHWRRSAGLTQAELGRHVAYHHSFISRVEGGSRWPPREFTARCDAMLGAGADLTSLWRLVEQERQRSISHALPDPTALSTLATLLAAFEQAEPAGAVNGTEPADGHLRQVSQWLAAAPTPVQRRLIALASDYARLAAQFQLPARAT